MGGVHTSLFSFLTAAFRLSQKERKKIKQWQEEKKGGGGVFRLLTLCKCCGHFDMLIRPHPNSWNFALALIQTFFLLYPPLMHEHVKWSVPPHTHTHTPSTQPFTENLTGKFFGFCGLMKACAGFLSYWIGWIPEQRPPRIMQLLGHLDGREATVLCAFALFFCTASTKRRDSLSETPHLPLAICPFAEIGHISWSRAGRTSQLRVNLKIRRALPPHPKKKKL